MNETKIINDLQSVAEWFAEHGKNTNTAVIGIAKRAIDVINRLQAENKKLQDDIKYLNGKYLIADMAIETATYEAVKDFAQQLKERAYLSSEWSHGEHPYVVEVEEINDILYEMIGEENG